MYEFLEAERVGYTIRLPANRVLQDRIGHLLKRPVGRAPHEVRRYFASFGYQAQSWKKSRRVVAKVEWHPGRALSARRLHRDQPGAAGRARRRLLQPARHGGAMDQGRQGRAIKWTSLSCRTFGANTVRLQLHALAYNLGNFMRTLALPKDGGAVVADQPPREADQDRRQRWSTTAATSRSSWPRSRCRDRCSRIS